VADTVDREHDEVGLPDQSGQEGGMIVPAAIMTQQQATRVAEHVPHALDYARPSTDIQDAPRCELGRFAVRTFLLLERHELSFGSLGPRLSGASLNLADLGDICGLGRPLLEPLAPGDFAIEAAL